MFNTVPLNKMSTNALLALLAVNTQHVQTMRVRSTALVTLDIMAMELEMMVVNTLMSQV